MPSFSFVRIRCLRICLPFVLLNNSFAAALSASLGKVSIKAIMSFSVFFLLADGVLESRASTSCSAISSPFCPLSTTEAPYRSRRFIAASSSFSEVLRKSSGIAANSFFPAFNSSISKGLRLSSGIVSSSLLRASNSSLRELSSFLRVSESISVSPATKFCSSFINV